MKNVVQARIRHHRLEPGSIPAPDGSLQLFAIGFLHRLELLLSTTFPRFVFLGDSRPTLALACSCFHRSPPSS